MSKNVNSKTYLIDFSELVKKGISIRSTSLNSGMYSIYPQYYYISSDGNKILLNQTTEKGTAIKLKNNTNSILNVKLDPPISNNYKTKGGQYVLARSLKGSYQPLTFRVEMGNLYQCNNKVSFNGMDEDINVSFLEDGQIYYKDFERATTSIIFTPTKEMLLTMKKMAVNFSCLRADNNKVVQKTFDFISE